MRRERFIDSDLAGTEFQRVYSEWTDLGRGGNEGQILGQIRQARQGPRRGHGEGPRVTNKFRSTKDHMLDLRSCLASSQNHHSFLTLSS